MRPRRRSRMVLSGSSSHAFTFKPLLYRRRLSSYQVLANGEHLSFGLTHIFSLSLPLFKRQTDQTGLNMHTQELSTESMKPRDEHDGLGDRDRGIAAMGARGSSLVTNEGFLPIALDAGSWEQGRVRQRVGGAAAEESTRDTLAADTLRENRTPRSAFTGEEFAGHPSGESQRKLLQWTEGEVSRCRFVPWRNKVMCDGEAERQGTEAAHQARNGQGVGYHAWG